MGRKVFLQIDITEIVIHKAAQANAVVDYLHADGMSENGQRICNPEYLDLLEAGASRRAHYPETAHGGVI